MGKRNFGSCGETQVFGRVNLLTGVVKWFDTAKGFGFIKPDDKSTDVFVHISALKRSGLEDLQDGQRVSYSLALNPKNGKSSAEDLRVL
jgi:cold shock protein